MSRKVIHIVILAFFSLCFTACTSEPTGKQTKEKPKSEQKDKVLTRKQPAQKLSRKQQQKADEPVAGGRHSTRQGRKILTLVNRARAKGCNCGGKHYGPAPALTWNNKLERAAKKHSNFMNRRGILSHTGKGGSDPGRRIKAEGYSWMSYGENIAFGYANDDEAVQGWLHSKGHCKNIMNPKYKEMGVATSGKYWTQDFGVQR